MGVTGSEGSLPGCAAHAAKAQPKMIAIAGLSLFTGQNPFKVVPSCLFAFSLYRSSGQETCLGYQ
jgi:hypothetical protein